MTSDSLRPWKSYGFGLVGCGCIFDSFSPGTFDCGAGRISIGQIGSPVCRL